MEQISALLLYQRLRNRVIEILEMCFSFDDIATFGAFETINMVDDVLPLNFDDAPNVFSEREKTAISAFLELVDAAAEATPEDILDANRLSRTDEWRSLSTFSQQSLSIFMERGRFSEGIEDVSLI